MKTSEVALCKCGKFLINPNDGFIVDGAIYTAEVNNGQPVGGLLGTNPKDPNSFEHKQAYCKACLMEALGLGNPLPTHR